MNMSYQVTSSGGINVGNMNAITINTQQIGHISSGMMSDDLSEPSSPDSSSFDASDLLSSSVQDDVTAQLAAAGLCLFLTPPPSFSLVLVSLGNVLNESALNFHCYTFI